MKKISILLAAAALSGCAAMSAISAASSVVSELSPAASAGADRVVLEGTRGLVLANNAYQGASAALVPLVNSGKLTREQLLRIRDIDNQVYGLLTKADSGLTEAQRVAKALNLVDELNRIAGK